MSTAYPANVQQQEEDTLPRCRLATSWLASQIADPFVLLSPLSVSGEDASPEQQPAEGRRACGAARRGDSPAHMDAQYAGTGPAEAP